MFRKLRTQLIATTMAITAIVLLVSFGILYASASASLHRTVTPPPGGPAALRLQRLDNETRIAFDTQRKEFADRSLAELRFMLIVVSIVILVAVYIVSRYVTDRAVSAIEHTYEAQRRFVADASHELKTPITTIAVNADAAIEDSQLPSKWLHNIKTETERMGQLVGNLLLLAKLDDSARTVERCTFDLSALLTHAISGQAEASQQKSISIEQNHSSPIEISSNPELLEQLIVILLDNAIKHSAPGSLVTVSTQTSAPGGARICISNPHSHIPAKVLERLFDRFYQADTSHHTHGHGLGLAIAKTIALQLGAALSVTSRDDVLTFEVELPLKLKT